MHCRSCSATLEGLPTFCSVCGVRLSGKLEGRLRWLAGAGLMFISFVIVVAAVVLWVLLNSGTPTRPFDWSPVGLAGVLFALALVLVMGKPTVPCRECSLPSPERHYCPDCGRRLNRAGNPFRLAIRLFGTIATVLFGFFGCCLGLWLGIAQGMETDDRTLTALWMLGCFGFSFLCLTVVRKASR